MKYSALSLLLLGENICPAIENIRSIATDDAWTLKYFFAKSESWGQLDVNFPKIKGRL